MLFKIFMLFYLSPLYIPSLPITPPPPSSAYCAASRFGDRAQSEPPVTVPQLPDSLGWLRDDGGVSGSSSEEESVAPYPVDDPPVPKWPLPPSVARDTELLAFWDLLSRPHGMSVRKLMAAFSAKHGSPSEDWVVWLCKSHYFVFFRARVGAPGAPRYGSSLNEVIHAPGSIAGWSGMRVRRLWPEDPPPAPCRPVGRLAAALECFKIRAADRMVDRAADPQHHAGAASVPVGAWDMPRAPFSHRLLDRRSDAEALFSPYPVTNIPPTTVDDVVPPPAPPALVAYELSDVITHRAVAQVASFYRRWKRVLLLRGKGDERAAAKARPPALKLEWSSCTKAPFKGVPMDLCSYPFRPLQSSAWPHEPPNTSLSIRSFRQAFRDHPDTPHKRLKGLVSHGNPRGAACEKIVFLDGPHGSSLSHLETWGDQLDQEVSRGWSSTGHPKALGLTSWPQRCQPTSMVERNGSWRLCHDMSWPLPGAVQGVTSPNEAEVDVRHARFHAFSDLADGASCMLTSGAPVKLVKADLSKAYKQNGQQSATMWARSCLGRHGVSQTIGRVCFGQNDGPELFSGQTDCHCFWIRRELDYAGACYPPLCSLVLAYQHARRVAARALGGDPELWAALYMLIAMIDDFGASLFDDPLFRIDGSAVRLPDGSQRTRAHLYFSIIKATPRRLGYGLDPGKLQGPCSLMLFLGAEIDLVQEVRELDSFKRKKYLDRLVMLMGQVSFSVADLLRMAFRLIVVAMVRPLARQWLHSFFRACRGRAPPSLLTWDGLVDVKGDAERFVELLSGSNRIVSPLSFRASFRPVGPSILVKYEDASGGAMPGEIADHVPGYGSWAVRGTTLFYVAGLWSPEEVAQLHITILESCISYMSLPVYVRAIDGITHVLEFTDNTGGEWLARRETPHAPMLQRIAAVRARWLEEQGVFVTTARVSSKDNTWADDLSRQKVSKVLSEAAALGLRPVELMIAPEWRDLSWLLR